MWDVSSLAYKETENKQKKMEELADKLCFVETFLFLFHFLFLLFSSVSLFYVSATALHKISRPCGKLPCVVIWCQFEGTSLVACQQPPSEGSKTNSVSEGRRESKNSASEADGCGGGGGGGGGEGNTRGRCF